MSAIATLLKIEKETVKNAEQLKYFRALKSTDIANATREQLQALLVLANALGRNESDIIRDHRSVIAAMTLLEQAKTLGAARLRQEQAQTEYYKRCKVQQEKTAELKAWVTEALTEHKSAIGTATQANDAFVMLEQMRKDNHALYVAITTTEQESKAKPKRGKD